MRAAWLGVGLILAAGIVAVTPGRAQEQQGAEGWTTPPPMEHQLERRQNCVMCHAGGMIPNVPLMPEDHEGRPNEVCLLCHAGDARVQTTVPPDMGHELEARQECLTCHAPGAEEDAPDAPPDHEGRKNQFCTLCHRPVAPG
jgi:hypothetical protein